MIRTLDITWLAGLIEGEGSFMYRESDPPCISIQMSDADIVRRVAVLVGGKATGPYSNGSYKQTWSCRIFGAKAIGWMMTLYPFLGERRQAKVRDIIERWRAYVPPKRPNRFAGTPYRRERSIPTCHPERVAVGNGLCRMCYMRRWRSDRMIAAKGNTC